MTYVSFFKMTVECYINQQKNNVNIRNKFHYWYELWFFMLVLFHYWYKLWLFMLVLFKWSARRLHEYTCVKYCSSYPHEQSKVKFISLKWSTIYCIISLSRFSSAQMSSYCPWNTIVWTKSLWTLEEWRTFASWRWPTINYKCNQFLILWHFVAS